MTTKWLSYAGLLIASSVMSFIKMILYAKFMNPELFGIMSMLLGSYAVLVIVGSAGMVDGSLKLASMMRSPSQLAPMMGTALTAGLITTSVISMLVIWPLTAFDNTVDTVLVVTFFFLVLSAFAFNICEIFLRAGMNFDAFARAVFFKSVLSIVLGMSCIYMGTPRAIVASEILAFLLVFIWFQRTVSLTLGFKSPDLKQFLELAKAGIPISISSISKKLSYVGDRWLILFLFGPELLGRYSFLMLFHLLGISVIGVVNTALGPILLRKMTKCRHKEVILYAARLVVRYVAPATTIGCVIVLVVFESVLNAYLPQYAGEYMALSGAIVLFGVGLMAGQTLLEWLLIGQDLSHQLIWLNVAALIVMIGSISCAAVFASNALIVVCAVFALARATSFVLVSWFILRSPGWRNPGANMI